MWLKQSTTITLKVGPFLDKTDGVSEETGITPVVELSKNGGSFGARNSATAITHDAEGWFAVELDGTDTNTLGRLQVKAQDSATHLPVWHEFMVVPANVWDSFFGADLLKADVTEVGGTTVSAPSDLKNTTAEIEAGCDAALDNAIPGSPTANSINERVKAIDDKLPTGTISDFDETTDEVDIGAVKGGAVTSISDFKNSTAEIEAGVDAALDNVVPTTPTAGSINERIKTLDDKAPSGNLADATDVLAIKGKTDSLAFTTANKVDARVDYVGATAVTGPNDLKADVSGLSTFDETTDTVDVGKIGGSADAATRLSEAMKTNIQAQVDDSAFTPTTTAFRSDSGSLSSVTDFYKDRTLRFTSGALDKQQTEITAYDGSTKQFTVVALTSAPANDVTFEII